MMVAEDPTSHEVSKFLGGQGVVTLATLGLSYAATASQAKVAIGSKTALEELLRETSRYEILSHPSWTPRLNLRWVDKIISQRTIVKAVQWKSASFTEWEIGLLKMAGYTRMFNLYVPAHVGRANTLGPLGLSVLNGALWDNDPTDFTGVVNQIVQQP